MPELVIVLHSAGDESQAESLAAAIQMVGYEVWYTGLTSVGDIELKELSDRIAKGGPLVICGTARAAGSKWLRKILAHVQGPNSLGRPRVFPVRLEIDADLEAVGLSVKVAECFPDFEMGITELRDGLLKHFPLAIAKSPVVQVATAFLGDHPHLKYDRRPVLAHGIEALNQDAVQQFLAKPLSLKMLQKAGIAPDDVRHSVLEKLSALGCICDGHPTLGAFLCFARRELLVNKFSGCSLQMAVFDQTKRATSAPSIELAHNNLLALYEEGMTWLTKESGLKRRGQVGRADRDYLEIPEIVLHEALANALVHRDYEASELKEQPSRLEVFPDRVEITSFGNLPEVVSLESLNRDSDEAVYWRRNPVIAQIFLLMSRVELHASGVSRMRSEMEKASLAFPRFVAELHQSVVRVVLQRPAKVNDELRFGTPTLSPRRGQLRVMLSSTFVDLPEHRKQAADACLRLGMFPIQMEHFAANDESVISSLLKMIDDSDVFIGIYGWRYDAILEAQSVSVIELEYNRAVERNIPMLLFMMHEDHPVTRGMVEKNEAARAKLAAFKERAVEGRVCYQFKSPEDLRVQLIAGLSQLSVSEPAKTDAPVFNADISRIINFAPVELIGREAETALLNDAWTKVRRVERNRPHILFFVALGGEGKTSLVAKWVADLAAQDWPGCDAVFAWSFYSQGTREQTAVSSDSFLAAALSFFGDAAMGDSAQGAFEKGRRLAQLVGERRALLILDGVEPLQNPPTSHKPGELKDQGLAALLKGLAATSHGLCVVTTRYALPDLRAFLGKTVREEKLTRLSRAAGVQLLKAHGVTGSDRRNLPRTDGDEHSEMLSEFESLVEDVDGHALTLHLMGSFLKRAFQGDIRRRDRVTIAKADQKTDNGHAFRAMGAFEKWMADGSEEARRELAILSLMGLFDRPATADCLQALLQAPAIVGLTEPLVGLPEEDWNGSLTTLQDAALLTVNRDATGTLLSLDAHPLLREYFAQRLKDEGRRQVASPALSTFQQAHRRLYEHLCATTKDQLDATLEDLQPLYQAVAHGCHAGLQEEACDKVFFDRILRKDQYYSVKTLGAMGSDLGAIARFFEMPWSRVSSAISEANKAWLLNQAAFRLRALGRLKEALEPMRAGLYDLVKQGNWKNAAASARNLSELELTLGEVAGAVGDAEQSVTYADRSGDLFLVLEIRVTHADALHQAGRRAEAEARFREAEQIQAERQPDYPLMYSLAGFRYCDLLLTEAERGAWQIVQKPDLRGHESGLGDACRAVSERAAQTLKWAEQNNLSLLTSALDQLTLGRGALYATVLSSDFDSSLTVPAAHLNSAVSGLRRAGTQDMLPLGLLTRAWQRSLTGVRTGPESAQSDLDEAWEIAERGPMPLYVADIHLHRARLFSRDAAYPWESPQHDLAEARRLIVKHGYLRRKPELEDAEAALLAT